MAEKAEKRKILFLSPYPEGTAASQRLKYEQYFSYLKNNNYELETSSFVNNELWKIIFKKGHLLKKISYTLLGYIKRTGDLFRLRKYDIVYIHLWATPLGPPLYEFLILKIAKRVVYDIDDLIFMNNAGVANKFTAFIKGKNKSLFLIKNAHHVITCTPHLNEIALNRNRYKKASDISSTINTDRFIPHIEYNNDHLIKIGWTGTHSTAPYLYLLRTTLRKLREKRKFKLIVIGNFECSMEGIDLEVIQWTEENEISDLQKIEIGLYPLPMNDWVMGKSGLKALQYMAMGIPTLATNIGAIHRIIEDGKSGILINKEEDWINSLIELIDHPEKRESIGKAGRKVVEQKYSILANRDTYLNILNSMFD